MHWAANVSNGAMKCIVACREISDTRWRRLWFCTINAASREGALGSHFVSYGTVKCIVACRETSETRWRRPWFSTLNAASLIYPGLYLLQSQKPFISAVILLNVPWASKAQENKEHKKVEITSSIRCASITLGIRAGK